MSDKRQHVVYRCYDADDRLIYVGCTVSMRARFALHHANSDAESWWIGQVSHVTEESVTGLKEARAVELHAIRSERPRWNVSGRELTDLSFDELADVAHCLDSRLIGIRRRSPFPDLVKKTVRQIKAEALLASMASDAA